MYGISPAFGRRLSGGRQIAMENLLLIICVAVQSPAGQVSKQYGSVFITIV